MWPPLASASDVLLPPKESQYELGAAWQIEGGLTLNNEIKKRKYVEERQYLDGEKLLYWVMRDAERNVLAVKRVPARSRGYEFSYGKCKVSGNFELRMDIIASVKFSADEEWSSVIEWAWLANPNAARFEPIPVRGIKCRHEGYGL